MARESIYCMPVNPNAQRKFPAKPKPAAARKPPAYPRERRAASTNDRVRQQHVNQVARAVPGIPAAIARRLLAALCTPETANGQRYSGPYASRPTALGDPFLIAALPFPVADSNEDDLVPADQTFVILRRRALNSLLFPDRNLSKLAWAYDVTNSTDSDETDYSAMTYPLAEWVDIHSGRCVSSATPFHGLKYYGEADDSGASRLWVDAPLDGSTPPSSMAFSNMPTATADYEATVDFEFEVGGRLWYASGTTTVPDTGGIISFSFPSGSHGRVRFRLTLALDDPPQNVTGFVRVSGYCPVVCHRSMPMIEEAAPSMDSMRINAMSLMVTNRSAVIYRNGTCTGMQQPRGTHWESRVGFGAQVAAGPVNVYENTVNENGAETIEATEGMFGFAKTTGIEDLAMTPLAEVDPVTDERSFREFPSRAEHDYLMIVLRIPAGGDGANPRDFLITARWGVEYETRDIWRHTALPTIDPEHYEKIATAMKFVKQWHTNKFHWSDIWSAIKRVVPVVGDIANTAAPILMRVNPVAGAAAGAVGRGSQIFSALTK